MLNRKVNLDVLVAATAIALFLFSAQANPKGVFLCFNDPIIKGDSTQKNFVDCIDANSVNLTINNNKKPYCTVSTLLSAHFDFEFPRFFAF